MATAMAEMRGRRLPLLLLLAAVVCALAMAPLPLGVDAARSSRHHRSASATTALQPVEAEAVVRPIHACLFLDAASGQFRLSASPSKERATTPTPGSAPAPADASEWAACATYSAGLREIGWDSLSVETSPRYNDQIQARAAGYIEGALTHQRIHAMVERIVRTKPHSDDFIDFLRRQDRWLREQVAAHAAATATAAADDPTADESYWFHIGLVLQQLDGMVEGYNATAPADRQLSLLDFWQLNDDGDRMDLDRAIALAAKKKANAADMAAAEARAAEGAAAAAAVAAGSLSIGSNVTTVTPAATAAGAARFQQVGRSSHPAPKLVAEMSRQELMELVAFNGHCSALVKLTEDDLLVGHNTWADYDELIKSYKTFVFRFHHPSTRAQSAAFTSYPGFLWSSDDFVATGGGGGSNGNSGGSELLVLETTITVLNESLYEAHVGPERGVMSWLRATVSGRLAASAQHWTDLFAKHNSGTYNNMWMVVDMAKVKAARAAAAASNSAQAPLQLAAGSFFVLEQIPGHVESRDMSGWLNERRYFASYNLPFFGTTSARAMYASYAERLGADELEYARATRARIFAAEQAGVRRVEDLQRLLRSNDYRAAGSLTGGCPATGIAARYDLAPLPGARCEISRPRLNGATDAKVTSAAMLARAFGSMLLVAGPTDQDGLPPFDWDDKALDAAERDKMRSDQTASRFTFGWQNMRPRAVALPRQLPQQQAPGAKPAVQQPQPPQQQEAVQAQAQEQVQPVMVPSLKAAAAAAAAAPASTPSSGASSARRLVRPTLITSAQVRQLGGSRTAVGVKTASPAAAAPRPAAATPARPASATAAPATRPRPLRPATVVADPFSLH